MPTVPCPVLRGVAHQVRAFVAATHDLPGERSLCNSAALLRHGQSALNDLGVEGGDAVLSSDWVRPGIMVYGSAPDHPQHTSGEWALQPAMTLASQLIAVQDLQPWRCRGLRLHLPRRAGHAHRRGGQWLCRRLPRHAPGAAGQGAPVLVAGAHQPGGARQHGHAGRGPLTPLMRPMPSAGWRPGPGAEVVLWGRSQTEPCCPLTKWPTLPRPLPMS